MDFLEFEVGTDVIGDVIEAAEVGSDAGLDGEVFIEAIARTNCHGLFGVITADGSSDVELADVVGLEETVKSSLGSEALLHLVIELVNTGIDGCEVVLHFSVVGGNSSRIRRDVGRVRGNVLLVLGNVGRVLSNLSLKTGSSRGQLRVKSTDLAIGVRIGFALGRVDLSVDTGNKLRVRC